MRGRREGTVVLVIRDRARASLIAGVGETNRIHEHVFKHEAST
jgi:hypothetical protein